MVARKFLNPKHTAVVHRILCILGFSALIVAVLSVLWIPFPRPTFLIKAINDFSHVPLFGLVALFLLFLSRQIGPPGRVSSRKHYAIAFLGVFILGGLSEWAQAFSPTRTSSMVDWGYDLLGAFCALGFMATVDRQLPSQWEWWRTPSPKALCRLGVVCAVVFALVPVLSWSYAYVARGKQFPHFLTFSSEWELKFIRMSGGILTVVPPPKGWEKVLDDHVGQLEFQPGKYPGLHFMEVFPDWNGFSTFRFEVFSPLEQDITLAIRIDDQLHNGEHRDRFNQRIFIAPGLNHIQIPLTEVFSAPKGRKMDEHSMHTFVIFAIHPSQAFTLFIDDIRLE